MLISRYKAVNMFIFFESLWSSKHDETVKLARIADSMELFANDSFYQYHIS